MLTENQNKENTGISVPFYKKNERDDSLYSRGNRVSSRTSDSPSGEAVSIDSIISPHGLSSRAETAREVEWEWKFGFNRRERIMLFLMRNKIVVSYLSVMVGLGIWWQGWLT